MDNPTEIEELCTEQPYIINIIQSILEDYGIKTMRTDTSIQYAFLSPVVMATSKLFFFRRDFTDARKIVDRIENNYTDLSAEAEFNNNRLF